MTYFSLFCKKTLRYLLKPLSFLPAILMMYLIFSFSGQNATQSGSLSLKVSKYLVLGYQKLAQTDYNNDTLSAMITAIHPYVRKLAHVSEYFLLSVFVALPLYVYRMRGFLLTLFAGTFCVLFAAFDEYHQSFILGRVASSRDILIDSIGIVAGIFVVRIVGFISRKTVFSGLSSDQLHAEIYASKHSKHKKSRKGKR